MEDLELTDELDLNNLFILTNDLQFELFSSNHLLFFFHTWLWWTLTLPMIHTHTGERTHTRSYPSAQASLRNLLFGSRTLLFGWYGSGGTTTAE
ncbi:hypothetical protein SLA2020_412280 [Shorea laevis]